MAYTYIRDEKTIRTFGRKVREVREKRNMTMEDLSDRSGITYSQLGRIERGEINTSISHASILAKALKIPLSDLFEI